MALRATSHDGRCLAWPELAGFFIARVPEDVDRRAARLRRRGEIENDPNRNRQDSHDGRRGSGEQVGDDVPYLTPVALVDLVGDRLVPQATGLRQGGRYVVYHVAEHLDIYRAARATNEEFFLLIDNRMPDVVRQVFEEMYGDVLNQEAFWVIDGF